MGRPKHLKCRHNLINGICPLAYAASVVLSPSHNPSTTVMASNSSPPTVTHGEAALTSREQASVLYRQSLVETARMEGDDSSLWISAASMWTSINDRYSRAQKPGEAFEIDMHDLWFTYYQAPMNISDTSPNQDKLAFQIIQAREQGVLSRYDPINETTENASTAEGLIWRDLPFLVPDMIGFLTNECASMGSTQRVNFASFLVRISSASLANDQLRGIALMVMRETFETTRASGHLDDCDAEDTSRTMEDLSVASLLPTANVWLYHAGVKLIQLSDRMWSDCPFDVGRIGNLLQPESLSASIGLSPQRWIYWLRRLERIVEEATRARDNGLSTYASRVRDNMVLVVDERHSRVKSELADAGGSRLHRPMLQQLGQRLD